MKTKVLNFLMAALALTLSFTACEQAGLLEENVPVNEIPTIDLANLEVGEEVSSELIATIQKDGHEIMFSVSGLDENQGVIMEESLYGMALENKETFYLEDFGEGATPFDVFVALTDETVTIPKSIVASAKENQLAASGRIAQENDSPVELLDANYTENLTPRNCYGTDIGYNAFVQSYCRTPQSWEIRFCDPNDNFSRLDRFTRYNGQWQKHRNTRIRINNSCGYVKLYFYAWSSGEGKWKHKRTKTSYSGINYFTYWQSNLSELAVIAVPQYSSANGGTPPFTLFRMETQFLR